MNGAHMAIEPPASSGEKHTINIVELIGSDVKDKNSLGTIHVGPNQVVFITLAEYYFPANLHVYEDGEISFPDAVKLYNTKSYIKGSISGWKDELVVSHAEITFYSTGLYTTLFYLVF